MVLAGDALCRCWRLRLGGGKAADDETTDDGTKAEERQNPPTEKVRCRAFPLVA